MLFDKNVTVPDFASTVLLEERSRPKVANPYNTLALRKQAKEKKAVVDTPEQVWEPHVQVGKRIASIPVSTLCLDCCAQFAEHTPVFDIQKGGPVDPPSLPPVPLASSLPQLPQPASSMSEDTALQEQRAGSPSARSRRRKV
jgi:hypothetical protein